MANDFNIGIIGQLDKGKTKSNISQQLAQLGKDVKINFAVDSKRVKNDINKINKASIDSQELQIKLSKALEDREKKRRQQELSQNKAVMADQKQREKVLREEQKIRSAISKQNLANNLRQEKSYTNLSNKLERMKVDADATNKVINKFGGREHHTNAKRFTSDLQKLNITQNMTEKEMQDVINKADILKSKLNGVSKEARATGRTALSMGEMIKSGARSFFVWINITALWFKTMREIQQGIESIKELDSAMLELRKVTDITIASQQQFIVSAQNVSVGLGRTTAEVTRATASFARMGFTISESLNLAEDALLLTNIGDGIDDVSQSADTLISTLKGFDLKANQSTRIIDALNEVSNNYAVNTDDLAEGIKRISSVMAQSGDSFEQSLGMLTGMIEIMQDAPKASTGLRTISLRLRGLSEEGEKLGQDFSAKLGKTFKDIADVDIMMNGELRSTFDIVQDLGKVWNSLTQTQRAFLAQEAAGKRQAQSFNALMMSQSTILRATNTALDSQGSALKENAKFLDSISGKIGIFTAQVEKLWTRAINSETIKNIVDFGTAIVGLVDDIGLLNSILIILGTTFLTIKNGAGITFLLDILMNLPTAIGLAGVALQSFLALLPQILIISGAFLVVTKTVDALIVTTEEYNEKINKLSTSIGELIKKRDALTKSQEDGQDINEKELDSLNRRIRLEKQLLEVTEKKLARRAIEFSIFGTSDIQKAEKLINSIQVAEENIDGLNQTIKNNEDNLSLSQIESAVNNLTFLETKSAEAKLELLNLYDSLLENKKILGEDFPQSAQNTIEAIEEILGLVKESPDFWDAYNNSMLRLKITSESTEKVQFGLSKELKKLAELYPILTKAQQLYTKNSLKLEKARLQGAINAIRMEIFQRELLAERLGSDITGFKGGNLGTDDQMNRLSDLVGLLGEVDTSLDNIGISSESMDKVSTKVDDVTDSIKEAKDTFSEWESDMKRGYQRDYEIFKRIQDDKWKEFERNQDKQVKRIDDDLEKLQDSYDTETFITDEENLLVDISDLEKERMKLTVDNSVEANKRRAEIAEELDDLQEELAKKRARREYELAKDSLEDEKQLINEETELKKQQFDDMLEDADRFYEDLMFDLETFSDQMENGWEEIGIKSAEAFTQMFADEFNPFYKDLLSKLNSIGGSISSTGGLYTGTSSSQKDKNKEIQKKTGMSDIDLQNIEILQQRWKQVDEWQKEGILDEATARQEKEAFHNRAEEIRATYGFSGGVSGSDIAKFKDGGLLPSFEGGKLIMAHGNEMMLNEKDTKNLMDTSKVVDNLMTGINAMIGKGSSGGGTIQNLINIDKLEVIAKDNVDLENIGTNLARGAKREMVNNGFVVV